MLSRCGNSFGLLSSVAMCHAMYSCGGHPCPQQSLLSHWDLHPLLFDPHGYIWDCLCKCRPQCVELCHHLVAMLLIILIRDSTFDKCTLQMLHGHQDGVELSL